MMRAELIRDADRQYIRVTPAPDRNIREGLWLSYDTDTQTETDKAATELKKGQQEYDLPDESMRRVVSVWVAPWANRSKRF